MENFCFYWLFAFVSLLGATVGEFSDSVCEPSPRGPSRLSRSGCEVRNISTEDFAEGFAPFAVFFDEQTPGHIFNFIEATGELRPQGVTVVTREILVHHPPSTQFAGKLPSPQYSGPQDTALAWNGGSHVIGQRSVNMTGGVDPVGELEYSVQELLVPQNPVLVDSAPTGISHTMHELAEPTKVRRFLKLVKRAACVTSYLSSPSVLILRPTDIDCVGQSFCCPPGATCARGSCTKLIVIACKTYASISAAWLRL
jgi:hypothetical protein